MICALQIKVTNVFSDFYGTQATGIEMQELVLRMLWVGYGILLISRMIGEVDGVLAFPSVSDALCRRVC